MTLTEQQFIDLLLKLPKNITKGELETLFGITLTNPWVKFLTQFGFIIYEFLQNNSDIIPDELKKIIDIYNKNPNNIFMGMGTVYGANVLVRLAIIPAIPIIGTIAANSVIVATTAGSLYWVCKQRKKKDDIKLLSKLPAIESSTSS